MKYFHQLTDKEYADLVASGISMGECAKQHPQPKWCEYPDAVYGLMGCWKLCLERNIKTIKDCRNCGFAKRREATHD